MAAAAAWCCACSAPSGAGEETGLTEGAIEGGTLEVGYPSVGYTHCTASLIAPSVILSAAHCGPPQWVKFGNNLLDGSPYDQYSVDATVRQPAVIDDLMLSHLSTPVTDRPLMTINRGALPPVNSSLTEVGFGGPTRFGTAGVKRSATEIMYQITSGSDPRLLTRWGTGMPHGGDSGGPLMFNGTIAGVLSSATDVVSPTSGNASYMPVSPSWIDANIKVAPPTPFGSLYLATTDTGTFYRASPLGVQEKLDSVPGTVSMVGLNQAIWSLRDDQLTKWDPITGETTYHGFGWGGPSLMTSLRGALYAIQGGRLWKVDDPEAGTYHMVGDDDWSGATSMIGADKVNNDNTLVIISDTQLFKVNPDTGERTEWIHDWWGGPTYMATLASNIPGTGSYVTAVYIYQDNSIWTLNGLNATNYTHLIDTDEPTAMVGVDGGPLQQSYLYFPKGGRLIRVDTAGNWDMLSRERWDGPMVMTTL